MLTSVRSSDFELVAVSYDEACFGLMNCALRVSEVLAFSSLEVSGHFTHATQLVDILEEGVV